MSHPRITAAVVGAVLGLTAAEAWAGPCSSDIAQFEAAIAQSKGNPYAGLTARQTIGADLNQQPTQADVAQAQARLQKTFAATMARAKRYDAHGNRLGCTRELAKAKRMYVL
jgi:hypothetical protein